MAIAALIVTHFLNASDRDTILAIQENIYFQYFLGFDSIVYDEPFNASLFVEIRKWMGMENPREGERSDLCRIHAANANRQHGDSR